MKQSLLLLVFQIFLLGGLAAQEENLLFKVTLLDGKVLRGEMMVQEEAGVLVLLDKSGVTHSIPRGQIRSIVRIEHPRHLRESTEGWMVTLGPGFGHNGKRGLFMTDVSVGYGFRPWLNLGLGGGFYHYSGPQGELVFPLYTEWRAHWSGNPLLPYTLLRAGLGFGAGANGEARDDGLWESREYEPGLMLGAMIGWQIGRVGKAPLLLEGGYLGQRLNYTAFTNLWWDWPPQEPDSYRVRQVLQRWTLRIAVVL